MMGYKEMLQNAERTGATKVLTPTFHKWEKVGQKVVGKLLDHSEIASTLSDGTYNHYLFETDQGVVKFALGGATDKEAGVLMIPGRVYVITFQGKIEISSGRRVNKFECLELLDLDETPLETEGKGAKAK